MDFCVTITQLEQIINLLTVSAVHPTVILKPVPDIILSIKLQVSLKDRHSFF